MDNNFMNRNIFNKNQSQVEEDKQEYEIDSDGSSGSERQYYERGEDYSFQVQSTGVSQREQFSLNRVIKVRNNTIDFGQGKNLVKNKNVLINDLKNHKKQLIISSYQINTPSRRFQQEKQDMILLDLKGQSQQQYAKDIIKTMGKIRLHTKQSMSQQNEDLQDDIDLGLLNSSENQYHQSQNSIMLSSMHQKLSERDSEYKLQQALNLVQDLFNDQDFKKLLLYYPKLRQEKLAIFYLRNKYDFKMTQRDIYRKMGMKPTRPKQDTKDRVSENEILKSTFNCEELKLQDHEYEQLRQEYSIGNQSPEQQYFEPDTPQLELSLQETFNINKNKNTLKKVDDSHQMQRISEGNAEYIYSDDYVKKDFKCDYPTQGPVYKYGEQKTLDKFNKTAVTKSRAASCFAFKCGSNSNQKVERKRQASTQIELPHQKASLLKRFL
ncbi:UNKNOWN [Stylonychia lemnae]|uniref:Uncharacterized protein n=1 Tax=Stylonychia lemnae TaxID=5949 RepID=A0A078A818_STYLE|nr:UNKNOWN [Stylonychia lemnae]|eukprot:CDW76916.1 UNKNOWN [Stylonychia lemnae]